MPEKPRITVLMAVYNDSQFLEKSINSILNQTFKDFEFLIIDDCSEDPGSRLILEGLCDYRIKILRNSKNLGLTRSLIVGVENSNGEFIARMDSDDISLENRLEIQIKYLDEHPEIGIVGSDCYEIDFDDQFLGYIKMPESDLEVRWTSIFSNPFIHSSVLIRKSVLVYNQLNYDSNYTSAQDFDLWKRLLAITLGANIPQPLIKYRSHQNSITSKKREDQMKMHLDITNRNIGEKISPSYFEQLCIALNFGCDDHIKQINKYSLAMVLINIWNQFYLDNKNSPDILRIKSRVLRQEIKLIGYSIFSIKWWKIIIRIIGNDWYWFTCKEIRNFQNKIRF
jgi:glycosyltransferase involved in cell wall biosynthesis